MRPPVLLIASLLAFAASARAEVTMDLHALDALPGGSAAQPGTPAQHPAAHRPHHKPHAAAKPATPRQAEGAAKAAAPGKAAGKAAGHAAGPETGAAPVPPTPQAAPSPPPASPPAATLPAAPPPAVAIVPVTPPPSAEPPAPPPPPPIVAGADSVASATANGMRVTFGKDVTDLSPASADRIKALMQSVPAADTTSFEVAAYATGTPTDPSTARRLSLSRALAVRSALIADGVPSARIYVRALGSQSGDGPADRVDLTVLGGNAGAKTQAQ